MVAGKTACGECLLPGLVSGGRAGGTGEGDTHTQGESPYPAEAINHVD